MNNKDKNNKKLIAKVGVTVIVIAILFGVINIKITTYYKEKSSVVTSDYIISKLKQINDLAVSKTTYEGYVEVADAEGLFSKTLILRYEAYLKAYVDLNSARVEVDDKNRVIKITIPHAKLGDVNVDDENYKIYNPEFPLFESDNIEAVKKGLIQAETDCLEKINQKAMIESADECANKAITTLMSSFSEMEEPYTFEIEYIE